MHCYFDVEIIFSSFLHLDATFRTPMYGFEHFISKGGIQYISAEPSRTLL